MSDIATLSSENQISISKRICESRNWNPGQEFAFIPKGAGVLLVPVPDDKDFFGIAKGASTESYRDRNDRY